MKKFFIALVLMMFSISKANALLPIGISGGIRGGIGKNNIDDKISTNNFVKGSNNPFVSLNAGLKLFSLRGEVEYIYRYNAFELANGTKTKDVNIQHTMANVYYEFFDFLMLGLYVNGGIGNTKMSSTLIKNYDKFAWSAGLGANISLLLLNLDIGYRYFNMGEIERYVGGKSKLDSHDFYVGIRFGF